jgi:hypothetical protein
LLCVALLLSDGAQAEPQGTAGLTIGPAAVGEEGTFWDHAEMHLGLRGDVLFGREGVSDFGAGPYAELGTYAFDELQFGAGGELLLPVHAKLPLVVSAGIYGRIGDDDYGLEPGVCGGLFWGNRSYNFHSNYEMAGGLLLGYRYGLGESHESVLLIAAQLDLAFITLPIVMIVDAIRGPSDEVAPVEPLR